jgi:hypothetical protein
MMTFILNHKNKSGGVKTSVVSGQMMVSHGVITDQKVFELREHVLHCDKVGECCLAGILSCGGLCHHQNFQ